MLGWTITYQRVSWQIHITQNGQNDLCQVYSLQLVVWEIYFGHLTFITKYVSGNIKRFLLSEISTSINLLLNLSTDSSMVLNWEQWDNVILRKFSSPTKASLFTTMKSFELMSRLSRWISRARLTEGMFNKDVWLKFRAFRLFSPRKLFSLMLWILLPLKLSSTRFSKNSCCRW